MKCDKQGDRMIYQLPWMAGGLTCDIMVNIIDSVYQGQIFNMSRLERHISNACWSMEMYFFIHPTLNMLQLTDIWINATKVNV